MIYLDNSSFLFRYELKHSANSVRVAQKNYFLQREKPQSRVLISKSGNLKYEHIK